jgi:hypothetical protein
MDRACSSDGKFLVGKPVEAESFLIRQHCAQPVSKHHVFYGNRNFITVFTRASQPSLSSRINPIYTPRSYFPEVNFNIIPSSMPGSSGRSLHPKFSAETLYTFLVINIEPRKTGFACGRCKRTEVGVQWRIVLLATLSLQVLHI